MTRLVYLTTNGRVTAEKWPDDVLLPVHDDALRRLQERVVDEHRLYADEVSLPIAALEKRYPLSQGGNG